MTRRWSSGARPGKPAAQHLGKIQTALMGSIAPVLTTRWRWKVAFSPPPTGRGVSEGPLPKLLETVSLRGA